MSDKVIRIEAGELRHVAVQPGDLFILTVKHRLAMDEIDTLKAQWASAVGTQNPLIVLELEGAELTVVSRSQIAAVGEGPVGTLPRCESPQALDVTLEFDSSPETLARLRDAIRRAPFFRQ